MNEFQTIAAKLLNIDENSKWQIMSKFLHCMSLLSIPTRLPSFPFH